MTVRLEMNGPRIRRRMRRALPDALQAGGEHILAESNKRVPHELGDLERSGECHVEDDTAVITYDLVYARRQHEELEWRHDPGRSAKYLELAAAEHSGEAYEIIAAKLAEAMGGRSGLRRLLPW